MESIFQKSKYLVLILSSFFMWEAAVSAAEKSAEEHTITFRAQGMPTPTQVDIGSVAMREVVRVYMDQNPHLRIEAFAMPAVGGTSSMDSGPLMAISAGVPPHAIYVNFRQSSTYIKQGFLEPMEILLARVTSENERVRQADDKGNWLEDPTEEEVEAMLEQIKARVLDRVWPVVYRPENLGNTGKHHVWALPIGNLVQALYYRKDLFHAAGLDPEKPPQDWEELLEYSRILTIPEKSQFGMLFPLGHAISWGAYFLLVSNGAEAMHMDENGRWGAAFNSPQAAESIYYFWRLMREPFERDGKIIVGAAGLHGNATVEWNRGKVAMRAATLDSDMLGTINPQLVGIAPLPKSPIGSQGGEVNARMLGVFTGSTPEQKIEVARFIWFLTSDEAHAIRTRVFVDNGYGQFVNPDMLQKFGYESYLKRVPQNWRRAYEIAVASGVPEPYGDNTQNIYRFMSRPINEVLEMDLSKMTRESAIAMIEGMLDKTVQEVNHDVLLQLTPEQQSFRNTIAWIVIASVAAMFVFGFIHIWKYFSAVSGPSQARGHWRKYIWGYLLVIPGVVLVLMWSYLPLIIGGFSIAFMDYRIVQDSIWVGVQNFANVLFDERFWSSLGRTFYFVSLTIGLGFWPPILLAILLQEVPTNFAKYFYRTIFYLPSVLIGVVVMFLWMQLYNPGENGILNQLLMSLNNLGPISATLLKWMFLLLWLSFLGVLIWLPVRLEEMSRSMKVLLWIIGGALTFLTLSPVISPAFSGHFSEAAGAIGSLFGRFNIEPLRWTQSPDMAMLCIIIPGIWASTGPGCIIYLAALKSVPDELYEAAEIDGAGHWHKIFYIVLPRLKYLIVIQFVAAVISAFKGGEEMILVMTGGGPLDATTILSLEIFFRTFVELNFGLGTAMAWIIGALLIAFTAYQLKLLSRAEFKAAG